MDIRIQTRKQKFSRAGEVSWNEGTLRNILSTTHQKNPAGKYFGVLSPGCS